MKTVKTKLDRAVKELFKVDFPKNATVEKPKRQEHGDVSSNVAFLLAKTLKKSPVQIATVLAEKLRSDEDFEKVEVVNGFINFFLSDKSYRKLLLKILEEDFYKSNLGRGKSVLVEFVSANPTGPLHVGHGRGAVVGDVLSKILENAGFKVKKEFYINDAGRQIRLLGESIYAKVLESRGIDYPFPEDGYRGDYITELARLALRLYPDITELDRESAITFLSEFGKRELLERIKQDLEVLRVSFDNWFSERLLYEKGEVEKVLETLKQKGLIYEKDGALWLKTTLFGDDKDRVLRRSNGQFTYFASDIAYHFDKLKRGFDKAVDVWGADHHGYIARVKAAMKALGAKDDWLEVLLIQLVKLVKGGREVKMSKRSGNYLTLRELIDEVGTDAVRFFFLLKRHDTPLDFDIDLALSKKSENPVYYVQYAHARLCSIEEKAEERGIRADKKNIHNLSLKEEFKLIKECYRLSEVLEVAAKKREPHLLPYYLLELSSAFHSFYNKHRILDSSNLALSSARLLLVQAVKKTLKVGLDILNIKAPRRM